jgi:hypothetical protein
MSSDDDRDDKVLSLEQSNHDVEVFQEPYTIYPTYDTCNYRSS